MKLLKQYGLVIFWALLFVDIALMNMGGYKTIRIYTKPLLMLSLIAYFYVNTYKSKHWRSKSLAYGGLICSLFGDIFFLQNDFADKTGALMNGDIYLFIGVSFLLIGFSCYTLLFKRMSAFNIKDCQEAFLGFLAMMLVGGIFFRIVMKEEVGNFKYLISVGLVLTTLMIVFAANVHHNKVRRNLAVKFFIPGSIILVITMGIIIGHKFLLKEADFLPEVIALTYTFGQMLIIRGFIKFLKV